MKKRVLATMLTVCLLFSVMVCVASAESGISVGEIISTKRVCPGDIIDFTVIEKPVIEGGVYAQGWEIQTADGAWIPYDGEPIKATSTKFNIRYFAASASGEYAYSNECVVTAKHNPAGAYEYSGTDHWRVCVDCGGQAESGHHTHLSSTATSTQRVCEVCGHVRTPQYTGLLAFWEWLMALITSLIG